MSFNVIWGNSLENLAREFYDERRTGGDPLQPECVIVGSPVQEFWLKQYFLDRYRGKRQPVLANLEFQEIHPFVNDWVACAVEGIPIGRRNPGRHPFSKPGMQWRIWQMLQNDSFRSRHPALDRYVSQEDADRRSIRSWSLSGQIARLFDDYINYRPGMLTEWEMGILSDEVRERFAWQPALWQGLTRNCPHLSYHHLFERSSLELLKDCPIGQTYKQLSVFHLTSLPKNYLDFFRALGTFMTVNFYAFNPCSDFWMEDPDERQNRRMLLGDPEGTYYSPVQPLLSSLGRCTQVLLRTLSDAVGEITPKEIFTEASGAATQLEQVQQEILERAVKPAGPRPADCSLQIHICHSPHREVEILKDQLLKWFAENPGAQPRDIRVLVTDMETYAPFIEAVFQPGGTENPDHIPATLQMFSGGRPGPAAEAFLQILKLQENRFSVVALQNLLELEPVQKKLKLDKSDLQNLTEMVRQAGIRWGADAEQIRDLYRQDIPDLTTMTWRHGLDRLLTGMALGQEDFSEEISDPLCLGELPFMLPCTGIEGDRSRLLEVLCHFFDLIRYSCRELQNPRPVSQWRIFCEELLELFLINDEENYQELYDLHQVLRHLSEQAEFADDPVISGALLEKVLSGMLENAAGKNTSFQDNSILFTPLQSMNITPADCIAVLGLNDGSYPRTDRHSAFDLIHLHPHYGDRSLRSEDRAAVLELLCSARKRLLLFYNGISVTDNGEIPPSPVLAELEKYLSPDRITTVRHRLHGFSRDYYSSENDARLFSYSRTGWEAAAGTAAEEDSTRTDIDDITPDPDRTIVLSLDQLEKFFDNPIRYLCREELQTAIPDLNRQVLQDQEIIETDAMQNYGRNQLILDRLQRHPDLLENWDDRNQEEFIRCLKEQSLLPPGPAGILEFEKSVRAVSEFLNDTLPDGTPLLQALQSLTEHRLEVDCDTCYGHVTLTGTISVSEEDHLSIYSRYASAKGKDHCRIHLRRLFGHAAGLIFSTHLFFKGKNPAPLPMGDQESARNHLQNILELYFSGLQHPLPFTPDMSLAFFEKEQEDEFMAEHAALSKWDSGGFSVSDCDDPYYRTIWTDRRLGPLADPAFSDVARVFWGNEERSDEGQQEGEA